MLVNFDIHRGKNGFLQNLLVLSHTLFVLEMTLDAAGGEKINKNKKWTPKDTSHLVVDHNQCLAWTLVIKAPCWTCCTAVKTLWRGPHTTTPAWEIKYIYIIRVLQFLQTFFL